VAPTSAASPVASPSLAPSPTPEAKSQQSETPPAAPGESPAAPARAEDAADSATRARAVNPQTATGRYTLQIAAKGSESEAKQVAEKLIDAGLDAKIIKATVTTSDGTEQKTWYRVRVGAFPTKEEAIQYGEQLKRNGSIASYFVTDLRI